MQQAMLAGSVLVLLTGSWGFGLHQVLRLFKQALAVPAVDARQVGIADLLALFVVVLPPLSALSLIGRSGSLPVPLRFVLGVSLLAVCVAIWWQGVLVLTTLRIADGRRRFVYLALVLPALALGLVGAVVAIVIPSPLFMLGSYQTQMWFVLAIATSIIGVMVGWGSRWVLAGARYSEEEQMRKERTD